MGVFDSIYAELTCPQTLETKLQEVQVKWFEYSFLQYNVGDTMMGDDENDLSGDLWHKEQYYCTNCSTTKKEILNGHEFNLSDKSVFHNAYIHTEDYVIKEVLSEKDYKARGLDKP